MPLCKIIEDYRNIEGWKKGDIVDITNPVRLIEEGKVKLADEKDMKKEIEEVEEELDKEKLSWSYLRGLASDKGLYKVGMKKADVKEILEEEGLI